MISQYASVVATPDQVSSDLSGETIILDPNASQYYGLNEIGTEVWKMIQSPKTVDEIQKVLLEVYDVDLATCDRDLQELLQKLQTQGLIEVRDAEAA